MTEIVFYVSGHPDDALLFRGDALYFDLHLPDVKVVQIVTTAGDAGETTGWWEARETGSLNAFRATLSPNGISTENPVINGKRMRRYTAPGWSCYFLRLPDGNIDNSGFSSTGYRTLAKLQSGAISRLTSVDGLATYTGWADFTGTLQAIFSLERAGTTTARPWVNASDYNRSANPGDHPDHYATADALRSFVTAGYNRAWWMSYDVRSRPANLAGFPLESKRYLFYAHGYGIQDIIGRPPNDTEWAWWGAKRYERLET